MNENDSVQTNKIERVFSFEDLYKPVNNLRNFGSSNEIDKVENLNLIEGNSDNNSKSTTQRRGKNYYYMYEKKLTKNSKKKLTIRLALIILTLIFIPLQKMSSNSLTSVEKNHLFINVQKLVSYETLSDESPKNIFNIFNYLLNKDFISGLSCLLYIIFHPFIALKLIYCVCILFYSIIIMKCFYQSKRPLWEEGIGGTDENDIIQCETSFSNPSASIFIIHFYFLYSIFCIKNFYRKNKSMNIISKIILFVIYIGISCFLYLFLLLYKLHFLHEMIFTNVITIVIVCLLMDFDSKIHKRFFNATKNIFKVRKNKIKAFAFCFGLMFLAVILYNFITLQSTLFSVEQKLALNKSCSQSQKEELGLKSTFNNIPYIFCMMGAFWGTCLAIENNPGIWWYQPFIFDENEINKIDGNLNIQTEKTSVLEILLLILKSLILIIVYLLIWVVFEKIPFISFEFNFFVACIKYFIINFICTGIIPLIFGVCKLNKKVEDFDINDKNDLNYGENKQKKKKNRNLFTTTLFVDYHEKARYPFIHIKYKEDEKNNQMIYSFSDID